MYDVGAISHVFIYLFTIWLLFFMVYWFGAWMMHTGF